MSTINTEDPVQLSIRVTKQIAQTVKIEVAKDDTSLQDWLTKLILAELDRRHIKVPK